MTKTYWMHRTLVSPMFINLDSKTNDLPVLLTFAEYSKLANDSRLNSSNIFELPHDLWLKEDEDNAEYIKILTEAGFTKETYLQARQQNYQEQLNEYFENGLYIQRSSLDTTVTRLDGEGKDPQKVLDKVLAKEGLGFRTGNNLLGGLSNRESLNVAIILEIPEDCLSDEHPMPVFEEADKPLEILTTYFGMRELTRVIPKQFIKGAEVVGGENNRLKFRNPNFDKKYVVENGYYDNDTLNNYVEKQLTKDFDLDNIIKVVQLIEDDFDKTKSKSCLVKLEKIKEFVGHNLFTLEADELYVVLEEFIAEGRKNLRTEMEVLADDLIDSDLENSSEDYIVEQITKYLTSSKKILREKFKGNPFDMIFVDELDSISKVLESINPKVYKKLENSNSYNDIYGEVELLRKILLKKEDISQRSEDLIIEGFTADSERAEEIKRENISLENEILFLNYAMCADISVGQKVMEILNKKDFSKLSHEQCMDYIAKIRDKTKELEEHKSIIDE